VKAALRYGKKKKPTSTKYRCWTKKSPRGGKQVPGRSSRKSGARERVTQQIGHNRFGDGWETMLKNKKICREVENEKVAKPAVRTP